MAEISVRIVNLPQIRAAFAKAPLKMTRELNQALAKSVLSIQAQSMHNTPVDTGRLRASHRTSVFGLRGEVRTNTNYAIFVHDGTRYMRGRPFLLQAVKTLDQSIQKYFQEAVQNTLDDIGRGV